MNFKRQNKPVLVLPGLKTQGDILEKIGKIFPDALHCYHGHLRLKTLAIYTLRVSVE